ncbi:MAG: DUF1684 domain-containing protein [Solirubrobacteraceae bacterium]
MAVDMVQELLDGVDGRQALVVGAGKIAGAVAHRLAAHGAGEVAIANRSAAGAQALAQRIGGRAASLSDLAGELVAADVVVCATAAPVISRRMLATANRSRRGCLVVLDLAVPRDVDPRCRRDSRGPGAATGARRSAHRRGPAGPGDNGSPGHAGRATMAAHQATPTSAELELVDWRRRVAALYTALRAAPDPVTAHALWRRGRDELMGEHPQSPLLPADELRRRGVPYWPYDPELRFALELEPSTEPEPTTLTLHTGGTETTMLRRLGVLVLPAPLDATLDVWWMEQYAGGLFVPLRDGSAGDTSYGGGRYLLDTAKGADLGTAAGRLVVDLNFLYHPSCRYNADWQCPLAPAGNTISYPVRAGERM